MDLTAAQIRARIEANEYGYHEDGNDWDYELAELLAGNELDAVTAWTHAQEQFDSDAVFSPSDIHEAFRESYRQQWDTKAEFARWVADDEADMGDKEEESKGRRWFLKHYGEFIDWDKFAESPQLVNTYSLIMLDPQNSRVVHAFQDNQLREDGTA